MIDNETRQYVLQELRPIKERLNEVQALLDRYFGERIDETNENLEVTTDTLSVVMEDILPPQAEQLNEVADTIDTLMTEILPSILE